MRTDQTPHTSQANKPSQITTAACPTLSPPPPPTHEHCAHTAYYVLLRRYTSPYVLCKDRVVSFVSFSSAGRSALTPATLRSLPCAATSSRGTGELCRTHSCRPATPHAQLTNRTAPSTRTHARTDGRSHARNHARTHTHTNTYLIVCAPPIKPNNPRYGSQTCLAATFASVCALTRPLTPNR